MKINVRNINYRGYREVSIVDSNVSFESGILDEHEAHDLAQDMLSAALELSPTLQDAVDEIKGFIQEVEEENYNYADHEAARNAINQLDW